jgi:hypothetical protein
MTAAVLSSFGQPLTSDEREIPGPVSGGRYPHPTMQKREEEMISMNLDEDGWSSQGPVTELADEHSWDFLQRSSIGRIALSADNKPAIFPIDFYSDGQTILFRTAAGTKLTDLLANPFVAFEADEHTTRHSLSVIIEGRADVLTDGDDIATADRAALPRWIPIAAYVYVRITPTKIHGRRFSKELSVGQID